MYWKEVASEAWLQTRKTGFAEWKRLATSVVIPLVSALLQWRAGVSLTANFLINLVLGVALYVLLVALEWGCHVVVIPQERDKKKACTIKKRDMEIVRLNGIMAGPEPPMPAIAIQAGNLLYLLRQVIRHGHRELWLSQLFSFGEKAYPDFLPQRGQMNYPEALRELFRQDSRYGQILESKPSSYVDFYGKRFDEDLRFTIGGAVN